MLRINQIYHIDFQQDLLPAYNFKQRGVNWVSAFRMLVFSCVVAGSTQYCNAQYEYMDKFTIQYRHDHQRVWDVRANYFSNYRGLNTAYYQQFRIKAKSPFYWGLGLSFQGSYGKRNDFFTASPGVTKPGTIPGALFKSSDPFFVDTFTTTLNLIASANVIFSLRYKLHDKDEVVLLLELGGISLPLPTMGTLKATGYDSGKPQRSAFPTFINYAGLFGYGSGTRLYQVFYRYWWHHKWGSHAGITYGVREFRIEAPEVNGAQRFRQSTFSFNFGIAYAPFYKKKNRTEI